MNKTVFLLWDGPGDRAAARDLVVGAIGPEILALGPERLVAYVTDPESDVPSPSFRGPDPLPFASLDTWGLDRDAVEAVLARHSLRWHAYRVEESVYKDWGGNRHGRARDWPDGTRSPGVASLNLIERRPDLPRDEWVKRWFGRMSPVSEAIQPRARYVRNLVVEPLTAGAPPWEAIVVECWPTRDDVTNPFRFYGAGRNPLRLAANLGSILLAVTHFTRVWRVRTVMTGEWFLKT